MVVILVFTEIIWVLRAGMRGDLSVDHGHLMNSDPRLFLNLASQLLSALLTLEFLDAGCNGRPAEPVARHRIEVITTGWSPIVLIRL